MMRNDRFMMIEKLDLDAIFVKLAVSSSSTKGYKESKHFQIIWPYDFKGNFSIMKMMCIIRRIRLYIQTETSQAEIRDLN